MSVLIKGMTMPTSCRTCRFSGYGGRSFELDVCMLTGESQPTLSPERMSNCPLVPVLSHGRLIDADATEQGAQKRLLMCDKNDNQFQKPYEVLRAIALAPTIIPAEEGLQCMTNL